MSSPSRHPGLFDLQVNGFAGVDFQQPNLPLAMMEDTMRALHRHDTSGILLTLITDHIEALVAKLEHFETLCAQSSLLASTITGYHIEGPYLSPLPGFHGAHPPALMKAPDVAEFERLQGAANGRIRLITLAPEWADSPEFIHIVTRQGVRVAIGHSDASNQQIDEAIAAGMTLCTHLGNGVPLQLHRHDNIVQRLLARDELFAVFIPDGIHLPPAVLRNFVRCKPPGKSLFTTDCMAAAGAPPGRYTIGNMEVAVGSDRIVRDPLQGSFAGSSLCMDQACFNLQAWLGWSERTARDACSTSLSAALGLPALTP